MFRARDAVRRASAPRPSRSPLARAPGPARRYTAAGILTRLTLQSALPGRRDAALVAGIRRSLRENVSCLWTSGGLVSCSSFVGAILRVAAEDTGSTGAVAGMPCDLTPYDLFVELMASPSWRTVQTAAPAALRSTALRDLACVRVARTIPSVQRSAC